MSKGPSKKQNKAQLKIAQLEIKKRNGLFITAAAFVGVAVIIALKLFFQYQLGAEWASSMFASYGLFLIAIVGAGFAGWGTRTWRKARDEIRMIQGKYKL